MRKEYFKSMADTYGYTANWEPNESVNVGDWTSIETGLKPWLNRVMNNKTLDMEISDGLHNVMKGSLGKITKTTEEQASMCLSHQVFIEAGISGGPAKIRATKAGGFFAIFQDIQKTSAKPSSFQKKIQELNEEYIAVISSVTHVRKGLLVIFSEDTASFTLPIGFNYTLEELNNENNSIRLDFDFNVSHTNSGVIAFQAEPGKMLTPFVKIEKIKPRIRVISGVARAGIAPVPEKSNVMQKYVIQPFSYTDFFETMKL
ncbi:MAG: hypothetical protein NC131_10140 [Roseburia sp.]|nr:hypothetical protein [Roseburia sp.]